MASTKKPKPIKKPTDAELTELAEWLRAVPDALLSDISPHAKYFERAAQILESLHGQNPDDGFGDYGVKINGSQVISRTGSR